jgi:formamidopyrimidine-DNA glycosylase
MPELPDLVHIASVLGRTVCGKTITDVKLGDPVVLRLMIPGSLPELLAGKRLLAVARRGNFLRFALDGDLVMVANLMLSGRFALSVGKPKRVAKATILTLTLDDGQELRYADETRMGKLYVARGAQEGDIPGYRDLGVDLLSEAFTLARFRELIAGRRDQVRQLLLDKTALAAIGNAYADEILFAARIHPKTFCHRLKPDEIEGLYGAIRQTLDHAIAEIASRGEPIDVEVRDFLAVRGRAHQPCRVCGTVLRVVRVGKGDACFCPTCQPTERKLFLDFRKVSHEQGEPPVTTDVRRKDLG